MATPRARRTAPYRAAKPTTFRTKVGKMYSDMTRRALEKRDKNKRLLREARPLRFDVDDLATWMVAKSEGARGEVWRCHYCQQYLAYGQVELDHAEPVSRGGDNTLANLRICCNADNLQKGELTEDEYQRLRAGVLDSFNPKAQQIIFTALRLAAMGRRMRFHPRTKKGTDDPHER